MNELIEALTELAIEATIWLKKQNGTDTPPLSPEEANKLIEAHIKAHMVETSGATPDMTVKKKAGRPAKEKPATPAEPVISEADSLSEALSTAKEFVQRFSNAKPLDGLTQARAILAEHFKVGAIPALSHEQRVELIGILRAKLVGDA